MVSAAAHDSSRLWRERPQYLLTVSTHSGVIYKLRTLRPAIPAASNSSYFSSPRVRRPFQSSDGDIVEERGLKIGARRVVTLLICSRDDGSEARESTRRRAARVHE